jgi:hypothetical protein
MTNSSQLTQQELQAWERCKEVGEDFTRLSQADQVILTKMIERQLTQGSAHFREQAEAWLADVLGEQAAGGEAAGGEAAWMREGLGDVLG